jgi:ribonuclease Z
VLSVTFLGTGAACPTVDRNVSGLAVSREGETLLFDCGEGSQRQMMRFGVGFSFTEIFFTHYHSDHLIGVIGLFRTMGLLDRRERVTLYGPRPADRILRHALAVGVEKVKFPFDIVEVRPGDRIGRKEYDLQVFETDHRVDTVGYAVVEKIRLGRFDPVAAAALGVPEGPLWGRLHRGEAVTLPDGRVVSPEPIVGPPRRGRRLVISGDTRPCDGVRQAAIDADLLIHEATFGDDERARAVETGHSTASEAAALARDAGVERLVLTHISARYSREAPELLAEASAIFPKVAIARDGLVVEVPFGE